ncbi:type III secretion system domain protein, InvG family [Pseudomonas sp. BCA14]|nr:type III secretion system domain protein, InvG family [Pseudomonas sp. JMN1]TFF16192.1 type III secretion system domain protein, InvG family [Pseudomonas sp. BCA17]TFF30129.1 type III secretion system domain protein, InvG family [Pseudomonas sp. BCA13]TFF30970.1 type III secretion system domain protein, InvG family [Pseudomonas sp. BCA14]
MHADFPATTHHPWLRNWLLCAVLLLTCFAAWAEAFQAKDESLHSLLVELSVPLGLPVVISREVAGRRVSGTFDFKAPQQTLEALAEQEGLIWYSDGQGLYVYGAAEARSSAVGLRHISVDRLRGAMRRTGLDESRYPLRESGARTFYVSGPPNYVEHVLRLAQLMDRPRREVRLGAYSFAVVQVFNTHVEDRQYGSGANRVHSPGMASMIQALLSSEQKGLLAEGSLTLAAYPDTNSLLIKGKPAQVRLIEKLVAELDVPKRPDEVSVWGVDIEQDEPTPATGPLPLTTAQYERVQRAFVRSGRELPP